MFFLFIHLKFHNIQGTWRKAFFALHVTNADFTKTRAKSIQAPGLLNVEDIGEKTVSSIRKTHRKDYPHVFCRFYKRRHKN